MARSRYHFLPNDPAPYFLTATIVGWLPLFSNPEITSIILNSLKYMTEHGRLVLYAYVIMENHMHMIVSSDDISKEIADFKSFTARKCIDYYINCRNDFLLQQLDMYKRKHKKDRSYQFWQEGSHPESIFDDVMFQQKVDYAHMNPVRRGYVDDPVHWRYSSARNFAGMEGLLKVWMDVEG